ncbi:hypothetical protein BGZ65_001953 [Modicella reniformis]|uniref:Uncharacterized protein n=1 Tax=Modicella reniformis TaxID=1440133 RepID=A0A9P6SU83_9FUNG|nr:hypothetical protein BGZ65_001953 [Modicella reniformis]
MDINTIIDTFVPSEASKAETNKPTTNDRVSPVDVGNNATRVASKFKLAQAENLKLLQAEFLSTDEMEECFNRVNNEGGEAEYDNAIKETGSEAHSRAATTRRKSTAVMDISAIKMKRIKAIRRHTRPDMLGIDFSTNPEDAWHEIEEMYATQRDIRRESFRPVKRYED